MMKTKKINISVDVKDMYQFLIAECRYGYKRNNHLMPGGAYDHVKEYLPIMYKKSPSWAVSTAKQLCEECISDQLIWRFRDGFDDENGNREEALAFIQYLLDWIHVHDDIPRTFIPYNYDAYQNNLEKDNEPIYNIYETKYVPANQEEMCGGLPKLGKKLNEKPLSRKEYPNYLFDNIVKMKEGYYNKIRIKKDSNSAVPEAFRYRFDELKKSYVVIADGGDEYEQSKL